MLTMSHHKLLHFWNFCSINSSCGGAKVIYCCRAHLYHELYKIGVSFYELHYDYESITLSVILSLSRDRETKRESPIAHSFVCFKLSMP